MHLTSKTIFQSLLLPNQLLDSMVPANKNIPYFPLPRENIFISCTCANKMVKMKPVSTALPETQSCSDKEGTELSSLQCGSHAEILSYSNKQRTIIR